MKTKKRFFLLALCVLFFANVHTLNAQVTIGSELEPNIGALLDLKGNDSPGANSTKGFNLPRVALTALNSLSPCADDTDTNKKSHTGLTVYNTTSNNDFKAGTYVWDGTSWIPTKDRVKRVDASFTDLGSKTIAIGVTTNVASFVISEPGYYAINANVRAERASSTALTAFYSVYIKNNNYDKFIGFNFITTAYPVGFHTNTLVNLVDYFDSGTYYFALNVQGTVWKYMSTTLNSLVKLSD